MYAAHGYIRFLQTISHCAYSASKCSVPSHYTHTHMRAHTSAKQWFSHSSAISPAWGRCKEKRRMILSHIRYNSPVDSSTERGDRGTEGRWREVGGGGCLSISSLTEIKKVTTLGFLSLLLTASSPAKRAFYLLKELRLMHRQLIDNKSVFIVHPLGSYLVLKVQRACRNDFSTHLAGSWDKIFNSSSMQCNLQSLFRHFHTLQLQLHLWRNSLQPLASTD